MRDLIELGKVGEIPDGSVKLISAREKDILLARTGGKFYAADNRCPHMGGNLSQGKLDGTFITCPRHGSRFDLSNGEAVRWLKGEGLISRIGRLLKPPRPLVTYDIILEDDRILIDLRSSL